MDNSVSKSDLIDSLAKKQGHLAHKDVDLAVKGLLRMMSHGLASGDRIEIRGFGSFSLHFRPARVGRNPKSGDNVGLRSKFVPHFKPGKALRERINLNWGKTTYAGPTTDSVPGLLSAENNLEQSRPE